MKKYLIGVSIVAIGFLPVLSQAQTAPLQTAPVCTNFTMNLRMGPASDPATELQVLNLQLALSEEGFTVTPTEFGTFGASTQAAVKAFQEKYSSDVLAPFGITQGTGYFGTVTRLEMKALHGCQTPSAIVPAGTNVSIQVANLGLDQNGVSATICNNGKGNLPVVPFRIRLNGINRDFDAVGAYRSGVCVSDTWQYSTWGLSYDPGATLTAIALIDPNGTYKTGKFQYPLSASTTIAVPVEPGYHLSVRSMLLKSSGLQATFCNLSSAGTPDLTSFPINITVNSITKSFDVSAVYKAGVCKPMTWTYDNWGITYTPGTTFTATIVVDPSNTYKETNEFDNVATAVGTL